MRKGKQLLREVKKVPFSATDYPITVAEVPQASSMFDEILTWKERDELIDCLAFQPDVGEPLGTCPGVRTNVFEFGEEGAAREITVVYFFHDLNMPLYVVAAYEGQREFLPNSWEEKTMNSIAAELVRTCIKEAKRASGNKA